MKVCQTCGDTYKDSVDFCFNDGSVLTLATAAQLESMATATATRASDPDSDTDSIPTPQIADPSLVDIDNLDLDDEPTQRTDLSELEDDDRTVPRMPVDDSDDDTTSEPTSPTENEHEPARTEPPPVRSAPPTEPLVPPMPTDATDPSLLGPPINFEVDDENADDEDTPVLQEPVLAVAPPPLERPADYESANTEVPPDSLSGSETLPDDDFDELLDSDDDEPAPIGGGPTLAPSPPPIPNALGPTLPLSEMRPSSDPAPSRGPGGASDTPQGRPAHVETRPLPRRPSSTPTLPAVQFRSGPESDDDDGTGAGVFVVGLGAFVVGVAIVGVFLLASLTLGWLNSSPDDTLDERRAMLPAVQREPLPPADPVQLPPDEDDLAEEALMSDDGLGIGAVSESSNPTEARDAGTVRDAESVSIAENLNGSASGAAERTILFESTPPRALVTLEGREPFRTPQKVDLSVGETYRYTITHPGYDPVQSDFLVLRGSGVLRRSDIMVRNPTAVPTKEGPIVFGPQGCRLRVDGTLMESEDIVGGTKIDETTGRPMVYLPFRLRGRVLGQDRRNHRFQVVSGVGTSPSCAEYPVVTIEYTGQQSIVLK